MIGRARRPNFGAFDFGLSGYAPTPTSNLGDLVAAHSVRLGELVGRRLTGTALMWDVKAEQWWPDGPVVLDFEGTRVEINHGKADEVAISWDAIDLDRPVRWAGSRKPKLTWRADVPSDLVALHGLEVTSVALLRWQAIGAAASPELGFAFGVRELTVFNAGDENGLWFGPLSPDHHIVWSCG